MNLLSCKLPGVTEADGVVTVFGDVSEEVALDARIDAGAATSDVRILRACRERHEAIAAGRGFPDIVIRAASILPADPTQMCPAARGMVDAEDRAALQGEATLALERPADVDATPGDSLRGGESDNQRAVRLEREASLARKMARRDRLREVRKLLGLRLDDMAQRSGLEPGAVSNALSNGTGLAAIARLVTVFGIRTEWLETGEGEIFTAGQAATITAEQIDTRKKHMKKTSDEELARRAGIRVRIKKACEERFLRMTDLVNHCGVSRTFFCPTTPGDVGESVLERASQFIGVSRQWLLTGEPGKEEVEHARIIEGKRAMRERTPRKVSHEGTKARRGEERRGDAETRGLGEERQQKPAVAVSPAVSVTAADGAEKALAEALKDVQVLATDVGIAAAGLRAALDRVYAIAVNGKEAA